MRAALDGDYDEDALADLYDELVRASDESGRETHTGEDMRTFTYGASRCRAGSLVPETAGVDHE